jgi:hypothetical protein
MTFEEQMKAKHPDAFDAGWNAAVADREERIRVLETERKLSLDEIHRLQVAYIDLERSASKRFDTAQARIDRVRGLAAQKVEATKFGQWSLGAARQVCQFADELLAALDGETKESLPAMSTAEAEFRHKHGCPLVGCQIIGPHEHAIGGPVEPKERK